MTDTKLHHATPAQGQPREDLTNDRFGAAFAKYMKALQSIQEEAQRRDVEAYCKYLRAGVEASGHEDAANRIEAAHTNYVNELMESRSPARAGEVQRRAVEAYQTYLRDVQEALTTLDLGALDPQTLAQVGQTLISAAYCSSWVRSCGSWNAQ